MPTTHQPFYTPYGVDANGQRIVNAADPTDDQDLVTKSFAGNASNLNTGKLPLARFPINMTLAEYNITNAYTKGEVDSAIAAIVVNSGEDLQTHTAIGSVSAGQVVVLKPITGGVKSITSSSSASLGTETQIHPNVNGLAMALDPNTGKVVTVYADRNNSGYLTFDVITCSQSGVVSTGTKTYLAITGVPSKAALINVGTNRFIYFHSVDAFAEDWRIRILTVSGMSVLISDPVFSLNRRIAMVRFVYNAAADRVIMFTSYSNNGGGGAQPMFARALTVSDTNITSGDEIVVLADDLISNNSFEAYYDAGIQRVVAAFGWSAISQPTIRATVISVNTANNGVAATAVTTIIDGSPYAIYPQACRYSTSAGKGVLAWYKNAGGTISTTVATLSATIGGTFTVGTPKVLPAAFANGYITSICEDTMAGKLIVVGLQPTSPYYGIFATVSVSGSTINLVTDGTYKSTGLNATIAEFDPISGWILTGYFTNPGTWPAWIMPLKTVASDAIDWVGIATTSAADGQSVKVAGLGSTAPATSVTPGSTYWVTDTGTLTTADLGIDRKIGRALTTTSILIEGKAR